MHLTYHESARHTSPASDVDASEAGAPEIEITPAMIEAGISPLYRFNRNRDEREAVAEIYRAMELAKRNSMR
jgi:hypothetical protein